MPEVDEDIGLLKGFISDTRTILESAVEILSKRSVDFDIPDKTVDVLKKMTEDLGPQYEVVSYQLVKKKDELYPKLEEVGLTDSRLRNKLYVPKMAKDEFLSKIRAGFDLVKKVLGRLLGILNPILTSFASVLGAAHCIQEVKNMIHGHVS